MPSITRTAPLVDGQTLTIQGSGFGPFYQPIKWDAFTGPLASPVTGWLTDGAVPRYSADGCFQDFEMGSNYNSTLGLSGLSVGRCYIHGAFRRVIGGAASRNFKPLQFRYGPDGGDYAAYWTLQPSLDSGQMAIVDHNEHTLASYWPGNDIYADAEWHRLESWLDLPGGSWRLSVDGSTIGQIAGDFSTAQPMTHLLLSYYYARDAGSPMPWMRHYWRWLWISSSRARVELRGASWAEPQPVLAWADDEITVQVRQGFLPDDGLTLAVVADDGMTALDTGLSFGMSSVPQRDTKRAKTIYTRQEVRTLMARGAKLYDISGRLVHEPWSGAFFLDGRKIVVM